MSDPKNFKAVVTLADGRAVDVEYPAASLSPTSAAIKAAIQKLGVKGFSQAPRVEHFRDGSSTSPAAESGDAPRRVRVELAPPGGDGVSIWVLIGRAGEVVTVTPEHRHHDLRPEAGWTVRGAGPTLVVESVADNVLLCREGGLL